MIEAVLKIATNSSRFDEDFTKAFKNIYDDFNPK